MILIISPNAKNDILNIGAYIYLENQEAALRIVEEIENALNKLISNPYLGVARDSLKPGYRLLVIGNYNALYRVEGDNIYVDFVLHHAQDMDDAVNN